MQTQIDLLEPVIEAPGKDESNELELVIQKTGVVQTDKDAILQKFKPILEKINGWKEKAGTLVVTDISQEAEMKEARTARLALRALRVEADNIRKDLKKNSTNYGNAVQYAYNLLESAVTPIEDHLLNQEKFKELALAKIKADKDAMRLKISMPFLEYIPADVNVCDLTDELFVTTLRAARSAKQQADEQKEADKIAAEEAATEQARVNEELRLENEKLKAQQAEVNNKLVEQKKLNDERYQKIINIIGFGDEVNVTELWKYTPEEFAAVKLNKLTAYNAYLLEKSKADAEAKELKHKEATRKAAELAEKSKGDAEKFKGMLRTLETFTAGYEFENKKYIDLKLSVQQLIDKIIIFTEPKI